MDYLKIYEVEFTQTLDTFKKETIKSFKLTKKSKGSFQKLYEKICKDLNESNKTIMLEFQKNDWIVYYDIFINRKKEYDRSLTNDEIIKLIFENEIKSKHSELKNIEFITLIKKLANHQAIILLLDHFSRNSVHYEMIYEFDKYQYFYKNHDDNLSHTTKLFYQKLVKLKKIEKSEIPKPPTTKKINNDLTHDLSTREIISAEFDKKERAVLFNLLTNRLKTNAIDKTELLKLILIIGSTEDFKIFDGDDATNGYFYKLCLKDYNIFNIKQKEKLSLLKAKLLNNGLKYISKELDFHYKDFLGNKKEQEI
ncbi:MAG: hypothetical protein ACSHW7_14300 [Patiriisocius sp.]|uniref:hypothetical protein n=1 Tax=Patiriisocius sp. TaxID=2822396 RepID=UPI003EF46944